MPRKNGRAGHGPAIGTPLAIGPRNTARPKRRHIVGIVTGGLVLAWLARSMPGYAPTIIATSSILTAFVYWHRKDPRLVVTVATWPAVAILAIALASTSWSTGPSKNAAKLADTSSVMAGGGVVDLFQGIGAWLVDQAQKKAGR